MSEGPYMGGRDVMRRTEELNDRAWLTLLGAFPGSLAALFGLIESWAPLPLRIIAVAVGGFFVALWVIALWKVQRHTRRMLAETLKRGRGWARS